MNIVVMKIECKNCRRAYTPDALKDGYCEYCEQGTCQRCGNGYPVHCNESKVCLYCQQVRDE